MDERKVKWNELLKKAVDSIHAHSLDLMHWPASIKARILVMNGEADPFTKPDTIAAFKQEMKDAGAQYEFVNYPGAMHAFTNPDATALGKKFNLPLAYNKSADRKSWNKMKAFLKSIFS